MNPLIKKSLKLTLASLAAMAIPLSALALTAEEIAKKVESRDDGDNSISTMTMISTDKHNKERVRSMKSYSKNKGEDSQSVIFFLKPSDVKNTSFLTYDYDDDKRDDDQWLYLPALNKTKRIPASDKDSSFMGSDFSYSDMTEPNLDDYNFKVLKESYIKKFEEIMPSALVIRFYQIENRLDTLRDAEIYSAIPLAIPPQSYDNK